MPTDQQEVHIYVDEPIDWGVKFGRAGPVWCHMMTDGTPDDLHAFAAKLGLKRSWYQGPPRHAAGWHYDLTVGMRNKALRLGAISCDHHKIAEIVMGHARAIHAQNAVPTPDGQEGGEG